jgi:putative ABC transport system permease protein
VLAFTLAISLLTAILVGLAPAIQASRPDLNLALKEGDRRTTTTSGSRARHWLAISEVALAMVLLVGAGLMINTVLRLQHTDPGFDPKDVTTMQIQLPAGGKYVTNTPGTELGTVSPLVPAFYKQLLEKVPTFPGVQSAGIASSLPLRGNTPFAFSFSIAGQPAPAPDRRPYAGAVTISPGFFSALKIPLITGRYLDEHDTKDSP